jgi:omega-6 fatty acid desaturase (delta-12 desaturase)
MSAQPISSVQLQRTLLRYSEPETLRSAAQLAGNLVAYVALWVAMWRVAETSLALALLLALPLAGFVLRIFSIQHDCGHGAFFRSRAANDWTGRVLSVLTIVPYAYWRSAHATHHATVGRLDRRGIGEIDVLTTREYARMPWLRRLGYRFYRHPLVLFGIGPSYQFFLRHRLPFNLPEPAREARNSILAMNGALLAIALAIHATLGLPQALLLYVPTMAVAAGVGVGLFYIHHNFEETYWAHPPAWSHRDASLDGSSYLALPRWLQWFAGHTGIHHVHHLCPRIPNYRLGESMAAHPDLRARNRLALRDVVRCIRLGLWDEDAGRLVSFAEAKRSAARTP